MHHRMMHHMHRMHHHVMYHMPTFIIIRLEACRVPQGWQINTRLVVCLSPSSIFSATYLCPLVVHFESHDLGRHSYIRCTEPIGT